MVDDSSGREVVSGTRGLSEKGRDQGEEGRREKLKGTSALPKGIQGMTTEFPWLYIINF